MSSDAGSRLGPDAPRWQAFYDFDSEGPLTQENSWHVTNWSSTRGIMVDGLTEAEAIAVRDALNAVARGTVPGESDDTVTKAVVYARTALEDACRLIETGDARLLASDGPAGDRPPELSLAEWRKLYVTLDKARKRLWAIASRIVAARGEASESRSQPSFAEIRTAVRERFDREAPELAKLVCESRPAELSVADVRHWIGNVVAMAVRLRARGEASESRSAPVREFLSYIADVRAGRVKRLDRDVVLSLAANMEREL